jgi:hypothetical protein
MQPYGINKLLEKTYHALITGKRPTKRKVTKIFRRRERRLERQELCHYYH